ncbi:MAG: flavin-containing monooxygenase [Panacagrimonas sp.]
MTANRSRLRVAVIGAGMSGLLCGIKLREAGYADVRIFEKADRVGGTWRDNCYPGLNCDVPSQHYCYSFELNPEWSRTYPSGPEIRRYLERTAARYGLMGCIGFGRELRRAEWKNGAWQLGFRDGEQVEADVLIAATGVLRDPAYPDIRGFGDFAGPAFHTARWDHGVDLSDRRVGVIGTGSTAVQLVPAIIDQVRELRLFQRTPQWILPIENTEFTPEQKAAYRADPGLLVAAYHGWHERIRKTIARAVVGDRVQLQKITRACRENLESQVRDPALRARLTPDYQVACKRLVMSEHFYSAIQKPTAHLVTERIGHIEARGLRTQDGVLHEMDALIYATGFDVTRYMRPIEIIGADNLSLEQLWADSTVAHRGVALPGFPNFFMLLGPNSPIGNFSLVMVAEKQIAYVLQLMERLALGHATVAPRATSCRVFNQAVREAMKNTVWVSGCRSWYLDRHGHPVVYPWTLERFLDEMHAPDFEEYEWQQQSP